MIERILTYFVVGIVALWLTIGSNQIERNVGRLEVGFPFVNMADSNYPTARGAITLFEDIWNPPGFIGNMVVYGVIVLTIWRVGQSLYTQPPRLNPSLRYLLPGTGIAGFFLIGATMGYNPLPAYVYYEPTPTPVPAHIAALTRTWSGTDATTGEPLSLRFDIYQDVTVSTPNGDFKGRYTWITPERIVIRLGQYVDSGGAPSLPCPPLPTIFNVACQQEIVHGYPAPTIATAVPQVQLNPYPEPQVQLNPYPEPFPTEATINALYQGIEIEYQIVVSSTDLTLSAPTVGMQSFTAAP